MATYEIYVPVYLYYDSDAAYTRDPNKRGSLWTTLGPHPIVNTKYNGKAVAIAHPTGGYTLGWVNDDDNGAPSTIATFNNFVIGENVPITISKKVSRFRHNLRLEIEGQLIWSQNGVDTSTTITWTTARRENAYNASPNKLKPTATLTVTTMDETRQIGSAVSKNVTAEIPLSIYNDHAPSTMNHSEARQAVSNLSLGAGVYVQGQSQIHVNSSGVGLYGSRVTRFSVELDGETVSGDADTNGQWSGTVRNVSQSGSRSLRFRMTDSRGVVVTRIQTIQVRAYTPPTFQLLDEIRRTDNVGNILDLGTYVRIYHKTNWSSIMSSGGVQRNHCRVEVDRKSDIETTYSTIQNSTISPYGGTYNRILQGFAIDRSYQLILKVIDALNTTLVALTVSTAATPGTFDRVGFAAGKVKQYPDKAFEVGGDTLMEGDLQVDGMISSPDVITAGGSVEDRLAGVPKFVTLTSERTYGTGENYLQVRITIPEAYRNNLGIIPNWNSNSALLPYVAYQTYSSTFDIRFYHANLASIPSSTWAETKITIMYL